MPEGYKLGQGNLVLSLEELKEFFPLGHQFYRGEKSVLLFAKIALRPSLKLPEFGENRWWKLPSIY